MGEHLSRAEIEQWTRDHVPNQDGSCSLCAVYLVVDSGYSVAPLPWPCPAARLLAEMRRRDRAVRDFALAREFPGVGAGLLGPHSESELTLREAIPECGWTSRNQAWSESEASDGITSE